jgi:hypothetical protein
MCRPEFVHRPVAISRVHLTPASAVSAATRRVPEAVNIFLNNGLASAPDLQAYPPYRFPNSLNPQSNPHVPQHEVPSP